MISMKIVTDDGLPLSSHPLFLTTANSTGTTSRSKKREEADDVSLT